MDLRLAPTLGETLAEQPGVNSTYYGPGSSRPVIRGLQSDRVRILESGVSSGDVSASGPDHAVALEPMLAGQVEIIARSLDPAVRQLGDRRCGEYDRRADSELPAGGAHRHSRAARRQRRRGAQRQCGLLGAGRFAWHAEYLNRRTGDYIIAGFAESRACALARKGNGG